MCGALELVCGALEPRCGALKPRCGALKPGALELWGAQTAIQFTTTNKAYSATFCRSFSYYYAGNPNWEDNIRRVENTSTLSLIIAC